MDYRERQFDPEETLRMALDWRASRIWTLLPCLVTAVTRNGNCIEAQPAINGRIRKQDGTWAILQLPKVVDCPVQWPGGGGLTLVFSLTPGVDEVLIAFSARCIDTWFQQGFLAPSGSNTVNPANNPPEWRMHGLSDGFAIPGIRNSTRGWGSGSVAALDAGVCRLRTDDDTCFFEINPTTKALNMVFPGGITANGVTIDVNSNLTSPATLTGQTEVVAKSGGSAVHLSTHKHPTAATGAPSSPTPGT